MWTEVEKQEIIKHYQVGRTIKQISIQYNCTVDKVRYLLNSTNQLTIRKRHKIVLPEDEIISLYKRDITISKISQKYNVSTAPIASILKKHNIRKPNWLKVLPYAQMELVLDYEYVKQLVDTFISKTEIANQLNCGMDLVKSILQYHNLDLLNSAEVRSTLNQQSAEYSVEKDVFKELHYNQMLPQRDIAKLMGISTGYLAKHITSWNLKVQSGSELQLSDKFRQLRDDINVANILSTLIKDNTIPQLMRTYDACWDTIKNLLNVHHIDVPQRFRSQAEIEIHEFILSIYEELVLINDRKIIHPHELDIVIPNRNIAIEYCGLYWHSEAQDKYSLYHVNKLNACIRSGYKLLTIFEDEWIHRRECVQEKIRQIIGCSVCRNINGRQCVVKKITFAQKKEFLDTYHIQGNDVSAHWIGLYHKDELVAVMTFSKPSKVRCNKNKNMDGVWELNRYATNYNLNVRGGAGKLLKHFQRNHEWVNIYSYADRRWSTGDLYLTLGFTHSTTSVPNYWYYKPGNTKREYRYGYAKYKLVEAGFDATSTEREIMMCRGYTRIWDCGVLKFELYRD